MATAGGDFSRCFYGTIKRLRDADDVPYVYGEIKVNDRLICAQAKDQWALGEYLDLMVLMVLDCGLHQYPIKTVNISDSLIHLN